MIIRGGNVFSAVPEICGNRKRLRGKFIKRDIYIGEDKRFVSAPVSGDEEIIEAEDCYVIPGLVDIHIHGCAGADFSDDDPDALECMAAWLFSRGVTAFLPASMTWPEERLFRIFSGACPVPDDGRHALLAGIHMEGPFISEKKKGAQNPAYIRFPDRDEFERLLKSAAVPVRLVTLAPELPGAMDFIDRFRRDVHISLGHSAAGYETAKEAFDRGADHVTHLFNAMNPFLHREPGIIGAAAEREEVFVELICDGVHVHPAAVRAAFSLFGADRIVLISDSMRAAGLADGESELGGQKVYKKGRRAFLADGSIAGSVSSLTDCMKNAVRFGIPLEDAVLAATANPARSIGLSGSVGSIREGARGNLVILDADLQILQVI